MTHVTCRLTAKNRHQLRNPTLGNRVWTTFNLFNVDQSFQMDSITKNTAVIATSRYHGISTEGTLAIVVVSAVILSTAVRDVDALFCYSPTSRRRLMERHTAAPS